MELITKIETNYFRSIYGETVKDVSHCNVFVGTNDCGKSNFLRALNLFFNNETGYDEDLNFIQDVTHFRQQEAVDTKGRLTIWMKVHFINTLGWQTLPKKFWIKKVWNRYSQFPEISSNIKSNSTTTRFLNKICFHYVPAVKERDIFQDYLSILYETLADSQNIQFDEPANNLSAAINEATTQLSDRIETSLKVKSRIKIPSDFQTIFEKLEFTTKQDDVDVPLANRGDGLQVRHIPHILDYVSRHNKKLNVWGYEEPENSLEMSNCFHLAEQFNQTFNKKNQIFITSHSPAFYGMSGDNVSHYLVRKAFRESANSEKEITEIKKITDMSAIDSELGVAQLVMSRSAEAYSEIKSLREANATLKSFAMPTLLTEGDTDVEILETAWKKLYPERDMPFKISSCDLSSSNQAKAGAGQLKKVLEATTRGESLQRIGLFDNDPEGRKCFDNLGAHSPIDTAVTIKINENRNSGAVILPQITWADPYFNYTKSAVCIEMLFSRTLFEDAEINYKFETKNGSVTKGEADKIIVALNNVGADVTSVLTVKYEFLQKTQFAKKVAMFPKEEFLSFESLFIDINRAFTELL